jgi:hypothetical protein
MNISPLSLEFKATVDKTPAKAGGKLSLPPTFAAFLLSLLLNP